MIVSETDIPERTIQRISARILPFFFVLYVISYIDRANVGFAKLAMLAELNAAGALDWSRAVIDSSHVRAVKGGPERGRARSAVPGRAPGTT